MEAQSGSQVIGSAMVVYGTVTVKSGDGVTKTIQPNEPIKLDDRIDTGQDGSVTVVFNDDTDNLELGRMTDMAIDHDVFQVGGEPDLADVTVAPELLQDILEGSDIFEQTPSSEDMFPEMAAETDTTDTDDTDVLIDAHGKINMGEASADVASTEAGEDGIGSIDDDLDLSNLIPPPDDAA